ncbi:MAG: Ig domain-containing protein, partial [Lachnospiraceae bacterium]|nr:Ig domain-containing protein [Lachnospiraceae bacterium]
MHRHLIKKICLFKLFFCTTVLFLSTESYASSETIQVRVEGSYDNASKKTILDRVNEIRKEAYDEELAFEYNGHSFHLKPADYHPLKWSNELEAAALIRAAEASILRAHDRPNGTSLKALIQDQGIFTNIYSEALAWNVDSNGILEGIEQFYQEKQLIRADGNHEGEIGHYVVMIHPDLYYTALSGFKNKSMTVNGRDYSDTMWSVAQVYAGNTSGIDESKIDVSGMDSANLEVPKDNIYEQALLLPDALSIGSSYDINYQVKTEYRFNDGNRDETNRSLGIISSPLFSSSDPSIASITGKTLTALSVGQTTITATTDDYSLHVEKDVFIKKPVESISILQPAKTLLKSGEKLQLEAIILPGDATDKTITWQTSDAQAASIDSQGQVTAGKGTTTVMITARASDNALLTASIPLRIVPQNYLSSPPVLMLLSLGNIYSDENFRIQWSAVPNADSYQIKINGSNYARVLPSHADYPYEISPLSPGIHSISVNAIFSDGSETDFSQPEQVTIKQRQNTSSDITASIPVLAINNSGSITTDSTLLFSFTPVANAESYLIQVVTSDGKRKLVYKSSVPNAGAYKLGPDKYKFEAGAYEMSVTARLRDGSLSPESDGAYFWIVNPITEDGPTLRMQTQGTLREDTGFELAWTAVPNALEYIVYTYDKLTGHTESYNSVDGSKTTLKIDRHRAGAYR